MRKIAFLLLLSLIMTASCRKNKEKAFLFEMEYPVKFDIPAGIGPFVAHYFEIKNIPTRYDSLLAYYHFNPEDVSSILPRKGRLVSIFGNVEYDFIKRIDVEIFDTVNGTVKYVPAFYRDPVPERTGNTVDLVAEQVELYDYMTDPRFNVRVRLELFSDAPQTIESELIISFAAR